MDADPEELCGGLLHREHGPQVQISSPMLLELDLAACSLKLSRFTNDNREGCLLVRMIDPVYSRA